ncbi:MAG: thioredoxin protein [Planctomycetota bacterium]|nr:thioredoxin protein [Planctomycetota bacterium]
MSRTARLWKGAGPLTLGGLLLSGAVAMAGDPPAPPLAAQLIGLGNQAKSAGRTADAARFFAEALKRDPKNTDAQRLLRLVRQDPAVNPPAPLVPPPPAPGADTPALPAPLGGTQPPANATIERSRQLERVIQQEAESAVKERIETARAELNRGNPEAAINILRLGLTSINADDQIPEATKRALAAQLSAQLQAAVRREEEIQLVQAETLRRQQAAQQRALILEQLETNQQTVNALMVRFDTLMAQGQYNVLFNGGTGNIAAAIAPFAEAHTFSQQARAIDPSALAPRAGISLSQYMGSLASELANEELKEYRYLLTMNDVTRASVPFPDTITIEYPDADHWRTISEKRIRRYESTSLDARDPKTTAILNKLEQPVSMPFANETPLEEVIKYIRNATTGPGMDSGIPIYVDQVGLSEAEKTMASPITLNLEGVPLKRALKLMLKQLELTYTVKDGLLTITSATSKDQPTEIRVYPVADLAIIPFSLMGGGGGGGMGGGGMGGGMGGMGGGGMGGGMGGMGGGMGGMGGGGGFRSMPLAPQAPVGGFEQKKSN